MNHWEYMVVSIPRGTFDLDGLNTLGTERWELVTIQPGGETDKWIFKREKHRG